MPGGYANNNIAKLNFTAVHFIFTPSPNIEVYQLAHYQCSVDDTGVTVNWFVNGTTSKDDSIIQLGIITNGEGSNNSSLTIPGYPQYNNTIVRCDAFGSLISYVNTKESILRIQGNTLSDICHFISSH